MISTYEKLKRKGPYARNGGWTKSRRPNLDADRPSLFCLKQWLFSHFDQFNYQQKMENH